MAVNEGLFINGCKKLQKYVQTVNLKTLFLKVQEEELRDIFVMNVIVGLVQKEGQKTYKKSFSKSTFIVDGMPPEGTNFKRFYHRSIPWIKKQIFEYESVEKTHNPREVVIVCDATFYGKKRDKLGTLVFKDILFKEILIWKHVQSELVKDYKQLLQRLLDYGYVAKAIIIDGKRGLFKAFKDYPVQMCHFHQKKVIQRYITMHPRLEAGKDLQKIMYNLTSTTQTLFTKKLNAPRGHFLPSVRAMA